MEYGCRGDNWSPVVVLKSDVEMLACTKPPLRPTGTSPQGEAYKAPIEGSCQRSRLRGGEGKRRAEVEYGCRGDHWSPVVVLKSDVKGAVPHETTTPSCGHFSSRRGIKASHRGEQSTESTEGWQDKSIFFLFLHRIEKIGKI